MIKIILRLIAVLLVLLVMLVSFIYLPPVQRAVCGYASEWVHENSAMQLSLEHFSLKFPLNIEFRNVVLSTAQNDTIVDAESMTAGVALMPLLHSEIAVSHIELRSAYIHFTSPDSSMRLLADVGLLGLSEGDIRLADSAVAVKRIDMNDSHIEFMYRAVPDTAAQDTTAALAWDIAVECIDISDVAVAVSMPSAIDTLSVVLPRAVLTEGRISMGSQEVGVNSVKIDGGTYRYVAYASDDESRDEVVADETEVDTLSSPSWQVQVTDVTLIDNAVTYITSKAAPKQGMDFSHIAASNMGLKVSDIYYGGSAMRLQLDSLSMRERSGLCVTQARCEFAITDEGRLSLSGMRLSTPFSEVSAEAGLGLSFFDRDPQAEVMLHATAHLACRDVVTIYPMASSLFVHKPHTGLVTPLDEIIKADIAVDGVARDIDVSCIDFMQPGVFAFNADAHVSRPMDKQRRNMSLSCRLNTYERLSLDNYMTDTLLSQQLVMQPITAQLDVTMQGSDLKADALADIIGGRVQAGIDCDIDRELYKAEAAVTQVPLSIFMPHDTVGNLSMSARISGRHFAIDNPGFSVMAGMKLDTLEYRNYLYRDIDITARMRRKRWSLNLSSDLPEVDVNVDAQGVLHKQLITADVNAHIEKLDVNAINFSDKPFDVAGSMKAMVVLSNIDSIVQADVAINNIDVGYDEYRYSTDAVTLLAASDITYSYLDLRTGDLSVSLSSDAGLKHLRPSFERLTQLVDTILLTQRLDMDEFHRGMPPFVFTAEMSSDNLLQDFLNARGMSLSSAHIQASNDSLFNIDAMVNRMRVSGMLLDTITFDAHEQDARLNYRLALDNRQGNMDEFAHVHIEGFLSGNSTRLYLLQNNRAGDIGFLFGSKVDFLSDRIELTFGPKEPIIGYKKWLLNKGNYVRFNHAMRQLDADMKLSYGDSHFYVTTDDRRNKDVSGVHVDLQNIELAHWFTVSPLVTPMSGLVSANIFVDVPPQGVEAAGTLDIKELMYNYTPMGTFHADIDYAIAEQGGNNVSLRVEHEETDVLTAQVFMDNTAAKLIDGSVEIKALPMSMADAFVRSNDGKFTGHLNSKLTLKGSLSSPVVDGYIGLEDATTAFPKFGVSLAFDNTDIMVDKSRIKFDEYGIRGANNNPLNINGDIDFSDMLNIGMELDIRGRNFQPIGITENRTGMLYGSVYTDVYAMVRGSLNNMRVNGYISLLSGTDATYIMQSNHSISGNDYSDMVSFVSFDDVFATREADKKYKHNSNTFAANIDINLDAGVRLGVNMSSDGKNRIDLVGGGNLLFSATALGDTRVSGRYTLTGGYVRYAPPFMSQKVFNIREGSYVTWNGAIADPAFNITAVQSQRSTVKSGDNSRSVNFDITIKITNTLRDLGIAFDLSTDEDLAIANELESMTAEQREVKAMNMFLYNSYTTLADAAQTSLIDNPLNTFLEYELNNWAQRTLRGIDLSFGISDRGIDASGTQRTDYSYKFSKTLFDNRLKVVLGGSYASNQDVAQNLNENLIDDISLEYRLDKRESMYLKVFRHKGYESIIEGEITETGAGFLYRKQVKSLLDLFKKKPQIPAAKPAKVDTTSVALPDTTNIALPDTITVVIPDTITIVTDTVAPAIMQQPLKEE